MVEEVLDYIDRNYESFIVDLERLVNQPSVSAKNEGVRECADLIKRMMKGIGITVESLELPDSFPLIYGEVQSKCNPGKTILFYNHYDVQPAEPLELWKTPPFKLTMREGKMYGRGAADNKGSFISRLKIVESWLKVKGDVPCNIKFLVEGEEEIGSMHLQRYFDRYGKRFKCDGVLLSGGEVDQEGRPIVRLGVKGVLHLELEAKGPIRDSHSANAAVVENPAWRLIKALNTLKNKTDRIVIPGWYKDVRPFTKEELECLKAEPLYVKAIKKELGIKSLVGGMKGHEVNKALAGKPTCNVSGLVCGWTGSGMKTVLPSKAIAKIDFRLVPNQKPKVLLQRLKRHLKSKGHSDIAIRTYGMYEAARTRPSDPLARAAIKAAEQEYTKPPVVSVSHSSSGPMSYFTKNLKAPCLYIGPGYPDSRMHSPNENMRIGDFIKGTRWVTRTVNVFAKMK